MLGDMLLLAKEPKLALAAYALALKSTPGRLRAEYGAAVSAQEAGLRRMRSNITEGNSLAAATPTQIFRNSGGQGSF
jgi:hypothetical protein